MWVGCGVAGRGWLVGGVPSNTVIVKRGMLISCTQRRHTINSEHNTEASEGKLRLAATALGQDFLLDRNEILHNMHASEYNENISHFVEY